MRRGAATRVVSTVLALAASAFSVRAGAQEPRAEHELVRAGVQRDADGTVAAPWRVVARTAADLDGDGTDDAVLRLGHPDPRINEQPTFVLAIHGRTGWIGIALEYEESGPYEDHILALRRYVVAGQTMLLFVVSRYAAGAPDGPTIEHLWFRIGAPGSRTDGRAGLTHDPDRRVRELHLDFALREVTYVADSADLSRMRVIDGRRERTLTWDGAMFTLSPYRRRRAGAVVPASSVDLLPGGP